VDSLPQLAGSLRALGNSLGRKQQLEIIFIDDGSVDGTADVIRTSMKGVPFRIITHSRNLGIGAAFRSGLEAATGEELVTIDSDGTYDPRTIPQMLEVLRSGFDIVTASPYHPKGEVDGVQRWRLLLSKSLSRLYWLVLPQRLHTYTSCYRAYRRDVLSKMTLNHDGFLGVTEMLVSAVLNGAHVAEMPTILTSRRFGASKIRLLKVSISHLVYLPTIVWYRLRGPGERKGLLSTSPVEPYLHYTRD
jgi:dolichol-phosphate mannosyltransferase